MRHLSPDPPLVQGLAKFDLYEVLVVALQEVLVVAPSAGLTLLSSCYTPIALMLTPAAVKALRISSMRAKAASLSPWTQMD